MKLISQDIELPDQSTQVEIQKILDHRSIEGKNEFLVKWKNRPHEFNEWVKQEDFAQTAIIARYWRSIQQPTRKTSKRIRSINSKTAQSTSQRSRVSFNVPP